jgi:hypothetical protein
MISKVHVFLLVLLLFLSGFLKCFQMMLLSLYLSSFGLLIYDLVGLKMVTLLSNLLFDHKRLSLLSVFNITNL